MENTNQQNEANEVNNLDLTYEQAIDKLKKESEFKDDDLIFTSLEESSISEDTGRYDSELLISKENIKLLKNLLLNFELIDKDLALYEEEVELDRGKVRNLMLTPNQIEYDADSDRLLCIHTHKDLEEDISDIELIKPVDADAWISKRLPDPTFSTTYSNNRMMEKESRAIYKLLVCIQVLKPSWQSHFFNILENYNFNTLTVEENVNVQYTNFSDLLAYVSSNARLLGKYLLSACNAKFVQQKKTVDPAFASMLSTVERTELESLSVFRTNIIKVRTNEIQSEELSWKKGELRYNLDREINELFEGNYELNSRSRNESGTTSFKRRCGLLFKASLLNAEALSEADVNSITYICDKIARRELAIESNTLIPEHKYKDYKQLTSKLKRSAVKLRISQYKRDAIKKINDCGDDYAITIKTKR